MKRTLLSAAVLLLAACAGGVKGRVMDVYGGAANWAAISAPDRVAVFRITEPGIVTHVRAPDTIDGYEILAGPADVDTATAKELLAILSDDGIYDFERAKGCDFLPGVAFRFTKGADSVDVLLCFSCDELAAYRSGRRVGGEDFDPARGRLLAIVKRLFPKDAKLQALR